MTTQFNPRDKSKTTAGKTRNLARKHTSPPRLDDGAPDSLNRWQWLTVELLESSAFRALTGNALKAFFRILIEHTAHAALENGKLIVTHAQFEEYGVTADYIGDAIDELEYKWLIKIKRGRSGAGTAHPNIYTLTFVGDHQGAPATNEWRQCSTERCVQWAKIDRKIAADRRSKVGRMKKTSPRDSGIRPPRNSGIRRVS